MRSILGTTLKVFLLFVVAFALTLAVLKWSGRSRPAAVPLTASEIGDARAAIETLKRDAQRGEVSLGATDLRDLLVTSLADSASGRRVLENSVEVRASVREERIEAGVVLATEGLSQKLEGSGDRNLERLASILELMPGDGVFLGARGVPVVRDGQLGLETASLELLLGPLTVSPEDLVDKIGLSSERIAEELLLGVDNLSFESVRVQDETVVLETRTLQ
jgi:hypothetical protein